MQQVNFPWHKTDDMWWSGGQRVFAIASFNILWTSKKLSQPFSFLLTHLPKGCKSSRAMAESWVFNLDCKQHWFALTATTCALWGPFSREDPGLVSLPTYLLLFLCVFTLQLLQSGACGLKHFFKITYIFYWK